ncbi:MAG TPA: hypothetical protein DDW27_10235 [Bacteroidales bacterium]|nr:hypothetical protein [Bacteroidales bacterium]
MNNYNPNIHHRRSIRLKGYDYSKAGLYFITICIRDRKCLFGEIVVGVQNPGSIHQHPRMVLNDAGKIADNCWLEIPKHFPNVVLHEYIIMPNHVHGIIELIKPGLQCESVGNVGVQNFEPLHQSPKNEYQKIIPHSIGSIVRGFKIGVTKWFRHNTVGIQNFETRSLWQHNYYEHIIRDEKSYHRITEYIINNPGNWKKDNFFNG